MSYVVFAWTCGTFLILSVLAWMLSCCVRSPAGMAALQVAALALVYYAVSITMSMFNKYLLTEFDGGQFKFPLCMTTVHLILKFGLSAACLKSPCGQPGGLSFRTVSRRDFVYLILPIGVCTALDISLSNISLLTVTLTLYTIGARMCRPPRVLSLA
jgi:hypothetical protein